VQVELINYRKDGSEYWVELNIVPVADTQGHFTHMISVQREVTERRQLEEQLRQSQKMDAVGQLAGGVAHDFNNILVVITGYSELLLERHLEANHPWRREIEQIQKAGERAAALTRQLLAFSRKQIFQLEVHNLNEIVTDIETMLRRLIGEDIGLTTVLDPALATVKADRGQIEQVLLNLVVNARDAMPQGGKLTIETANAELDQAYALRHLDVKPGAYVMLAVSDTGIGMSAETQVRIFEPFFTTKEPGKGTGLGLATVYGIVKQSGGTLWVYSEPGHGTTFKIYLPQLRESIPLAEPDKGRPAAPQGAETILLVEDEAMVRELICTVLTKQGYTVLEASDGSAALRLNERHPDAIHLLLTDVVMPHMSGRELAEFLGPLRPQMKILYMSGYTDDAIIRHGVLEPGVDLLQKPFTPVNLARKVREMLDSSSRSGEVG
jgi:two-component system, cell cycle sensor histidine kinase and response regulator CckA